MMKTQIKIAILFIIQAILISCSTESVKTNYLDGAPVVAKKVLIDGEELIDLDPSLLKDTVEIPISYFTEYIEFIKLDPQDEALVSAYKIVRSDNYLLTLSTKGIPCKLFDKQGNFITNIGAVGQGPGEYTSVYYAKVDEKNDRIYIVEYRGKEMLTYNLKGTNLPSIPFTYEPTACIFKIFEDNILVMTFPNPDQLGCIWVQDMEGDLLYEIPSSNLNIPFDHGNEIFSYNNTPDIDLSFWIWNNPPLDTLYQVDLEKKKLIPRFTATFKEDKLKPHHYVDWAGYYLGSTSTIIFFSSVNEKGEYTTYKEGDPPAYYIVDKKTLQGAYVRLVNDFLGGEKVEFLPWIFRNGYWIQCVDPGDLEERIEKALQSNRLTPEMKERLTTLHASISENDNNYIISAKMKK